MTSPDEQVLRQRLHQELDRAARPGRPGGRGHPARHRAARPALGGRGVRAGRGGRRGGVRPAAVRPGPARRRLGRDAQVTRARQATAGRHRPAPVLTGTAFAAGSTAGRPWLLSVRNIADPGARCLPAIMLNATDGYLPSPGAGVAGGIASLAFLTNVPGQPATGYAALRVSPAVTRLTAGLRDGRTLVLHPVTIEACGQRLPLAGFSYPRSGVATITAFAGTQVLARVTPPASLFSQTAAPAGGYAAAGTPGSAGSTLRLVPGVWQQLWRTPRPVAAGTVAAGQLDGTRWRISVQLGAAGDCFLGRTFGGQVATQATDCVPIAAPPGTVTLQRFLIQQAHRADRLRRAGQPADRVPGGQAVRWPLAPGPAGPGRRAALLRAGVAGQPDGDPGHRI